jgi:hypothetical protein
VQRETIAQSVYEYSECARRIFQRALIWQESYFPCSTTSAFSKCIYTSAYGILLLLAYVCVRLQTSRINTCRTRSHPALRAGAIALFGSVTCSSFSLGCLPTARGESPPSAGEQQTPVCAERWRGMHNVKDDVRAWHMLHAKHVEWRVHTRAV